MKTLECNVSVKYKTQEVHGYLITSSRQALKLDESFSNLLGSIFDNKTVLVVKDLQFKISENLLISGRQ